MKKTTMKDKSQIMIGLAATVIVFASSLTGCCAPKAENASEATIRAASAENTLTMVQSETVEHYNYYVYDAMKDGFSSIRSDVFLPKYYVFAGSKTEEEANELVAELDMLSNVREWAGQIYVINPINGETYGKDDTEAFIDLVGGAINNVKVIGIDGGATFVNNSVSQSCYFVAGMMVYGGEMQEGLIPTDVVPVYISNADSAVANSYKEATKATVESNKDGYTLYTNEEKPFQAVAIAEKKETLAEAFHHAWNGIFFEKLSSTQYDR